MPTISSALRLLNSVLSSDLSSPPKTRCSNCRPLFLASFAAMPLLPPCLLKISEIDAACALDQERMQRLAARHQAREARRRTVVVVRAAAMIGDDAAGLFDQERRRGQVPLAFVRERDGGVGAA